MNALRVALAWRKEIDNQQMDALTNQFDRFVDKGMQSMPAVLIAWRNDFDNRDYRSVIVSDGNSIGFRGIDFYFRLLYESRSWRCDIDRDATGWSGMRRCALRKFLQS